MEKNEEKKKEVMEDGRGRRVLQEGSGPDDVFDFGKHHGKTFQVVCFSDPGNCDWTVRQDRPLTWKSKCFKYFAQKVNDLHGKRNGKRVKDDDVELQLRAKMLEVRCEEHPEKLAQEETRAMEDVTRGRRVQWSDLAEKTQREEPGKSTQDRDRERKAR